MKQAALTAIGGLVGGFGTLIVCSAAGSAETPPSVLVMAAFGTILGALLPRFVASRNR